MKEGRKEGRKEEEGSKNKEINLCFCGVCVCEKMKMRK